MARWRNIPTKFSWDGENVVPASVKRRPTPVRPSKVPVAVLEPESPETSSESLPLGKLDGLSDEEKVAALRTEAALDAILALVPDVETVAPQPESPPSSQPESQPEAKPAETAAVEEPEKMSGDRTDLWESPVQDLPTGNAAIYPDGRPISNPNHLMLFVGRGAEIVRQYRQDGWISHMCRADGRKNPVPEPLVETLINSGILKEGRPGVFRGD